MKSNRQLRLSGRLEALQPLASAPIKPKSIPDYKERYAGGDKDTARLPRMRVYDDECQFTAYFQSSSIRHALRESAVNHVSSVHGPWSSAIDRYLLIGGVKGTGSETHLDIDKIKALRQAVPLLGVFGATTDLGNPWLAGGLSVEDVIPETPLPQPDIKTGVRMDANRNGSRIEFLTEDAADALMKQAAAERKRAALGRDLKNSTGKEEKIRLQTEIDTLVEENGIKDVSTQMPLSGYEYIAPGTPLRHGLTLAYESEAEVGLLLHALSRFSFRPYLGAHFANGCGMVKLSYEATLIDGIEATPMGVLTIAPYEGLGIEGELLQGYCDNAIKACDRVLSENTTQEALCG